jgi:hypothetical protein
MHKPDQAVIQEQLEIFATASSLLHDASGQSRRKVWRERAAETGLADLYGKDSLTDNQPLQAAPHRFDFRQLGHVFPSSGFFPSALATVRSCTLGQKCIG